MTLFLSKMAAIFNVSFLILFAALSQEMVVASDDGLGISSVPHNRQKRMVAPPGAIEVHDLPPFLAYNLREVHMTEPCRVRITRNRIIVGVGYAIHPYLVLTRRSHIGDGLNYGVSMYLQYGRIWIPRQVEHAYPDADEEFVMILLKDPLVFDQRVPGGLANYPISVTNWAYHVALEWIHTELSRLHTLLAQPLHEIHLNHPTEVQITSNGVPPRPGYAIHPYIVMTRPHFMGRNYGVAVRMGTSGELRPHHIQIYFTNSDEDVVVILLLDPILLTQDATGALSVAGYSHEAIAWVHAVAENWKHNMLYTQRNFYHENSV